MGEEEKKRDVRGVRGTARDSYGKGRERVKGKTSDEDGRQGAD